MVLNIGQAYQALQERELKTSWKSKLSPPTFCPRRVDFVTRISVETIRERLMPIGSDSLSCWTLCKSCEYKAACIFTCLLIGDGRLSHVEERRVEDGRKRKRQ